MPIYSKTSLLCLRVSVHVCECGYMPWHMYVCLRTTLHALFNFHFICIVSLLFVAMYPTATEVSSAISLGHEELCCEETRDHGNPYKRKHFIGAGLQFRGLVHYHHGGKHGSIQADVVLEKELRVLHLDLKAAEKD